MKTCLMVASLVTALAASASVSAQTNPFNKDAAAGPAQAEQGKASPWSRSSTPLVARPGGAVSNDLGPDNTQRSVQVGKKGPAELIQPDLPTPQRPMEKKK